MAVPKHKVSKARKNSRNASNFKVSAPTLAECPECHEFKAAHKVCRKCGYYDGKKVIELQKNKENK